MKLTVFILLSAGLALLSRRRLRAPRSHGFYRFFAFESILGLVLVNAGHWFRDPFSISQVVSWLLLLSSVAMAVQGFYLLRAMGRPEHGSESTTVLVKHGIYRYVRHPLYSSLLLFAWGVFFRNASAFSAALAVVASAFLVATARVEESENLKRFGAAYAAYLRTTHMFHPVRGLRKMTGGNRTADHLKPMKER